MTTDAIDRIRALKLTDEKQVDIKMKHLLLAAGTGKSPFGLMDNIIAQVADAAYDKLLKGLVEITDEIIVDAVHKTPFDISIDERALANAASYLGRILREALAPTETCP